MINISPVVPPEDLWIYLIAFAYIDPGSGSIILQLLIASVVGAAFYLRKFIANIVRQIRDRLFRKSNEFEEGSI